MVTLNGNTVYLGQYGTEASHNRYDRVIAEWLANGRRVSAPQETPSSISVNELLLAYLEFSEDYYRKNGKPTVEISKVKVALQRKVALPGSDVRCSKHYECRPKRRATTRTARHVPETISRLITSCESRTYTQSRKQLCAVVVVIRWLKRMYGCHMVTEFGPLALKAVRQALIEDGLCRRYINEQIARIKRIFKWGVEYELVTSDVFHALQAVPGLRRGRTSARESDPIKSVPVEHVDAVKPHVSKQVWAMIQLQLLTGMRPGEVRIMRACDIDMSSEIWEYCPSVHKNEHRGRDRVVLLGTKAQEIIRPFLQPDTTAYLFSPTDAVEEQRGQRRANRKSPMTPSQADRSRRQHPDWEPGKSYDRCSYRRAIRRACDKAEVPQWHPHQLRHTAATRIRREFGLEAAQVILGHSRADVTQIYAERDLAKARDVAARIG